MKLSDTPLEVQPYPPKALAFSAIRISDLELRYFLLFRSDV